MVRAAIVLLLLALMPSAAQAEKRIALLIGNQSYTSEIGRLANPHNDIALLEKALKGLGFEVAVERDASLGALTRAVNAYARRVRAAGPNAVGFFYYSGHGAADAGINYLIPVDVKSAEDSELWDQSLRLTEITRKLKSEAGNATHFVVFDACRNTLKLKNGGLAGARAVQGLRAGRAGKRHADRLCDGGGRAGLRCGRRRRALCQGAGRGDRQAGRRGRLHVPPRAACACARRSARSRGSASVRWAMCIWPGVQTPSHQAGAADASCPAAERGSARRGPRSRTRATAREFEAFVPGMARANRSTPTGRAPN